MGETPSHTRAHWRGPQGPKIYTNPPTENQHLKGHKLFVGSEGNDGKWHESRASGIVPSDPSPTYSAPPSTAKKVAPPW